MQVFTKTMPADDCRQGSHFLGRFLHQQEIRMIAFDEGRHIFDGSAR
jgi:hypothetical protein